MRNLLFLPLVFVSLFLMMACAGDKSEADQEGWLLEHGAYPYATPWDEHYFYTMQHPSGDTIILYQTDDLHKLHDAQSRVVWAVDSLHHIWSPELHRIHDKWYLYFEADAGNTDNHQLYVLENDATNPMEGDFKLKGAIQTNDEWNFGLHPTSVVVKGQQYLLWSGWPHRRSETETQCIYIARMENPWTLASERVMLSQPELEWERQWIDPDGQRSNYPIFVNENPEAYVTPDGRHVFVCYSASCIWTVYNKMGMLYASTEADLLDVQSWTKMTEPQLVPANGSALYGTSNISIVPDGSGQRFLLLYEAKTREVTGEKRGIRIKPIGWKEDGLPDFGHPK